MSILQNLEQIKKKAISINIVVCEGASVREFVWAYSRGKKEREEKKTRDV